jgi:hypothetical protein
MALMQHKLLNALNIAFSVKYLLVLQPSPSSSLFGQSFSELHTFSMSMQRPLTGQAHSLGKQV